MIKKIEPNGYEIMW